MSFDTGYVSAMADQGNMENVHTRRIAGFVSGLTYEEIPSEVRERIKLLMLDSLGCAIYGANLEWCRILRGTLRKARRNAHHLDLGHDARLSSPITRRSSTARKYRASNSMTYTARRCCTSAR